MNRIIKWAKSLFRKRQQNAFYIKSVNYAAGIMDITEPGAKWRDVKPGQKRIEVVLEQTGQINDKDIYKAIAKGLPVTITILE